MEQNFQQNNPKTNHPLRWPDNIEKEINKIKVKLLHFPVKEIARCLEHNNIIFKCAGIRALADRKEHDYASYVLKLIDKKVNKLIRLESVIALGKMQNEEAIEPLKKLLYYEPFEIRTAAIMSLAKIGSSAVVPAFIQTLEDKDARIRIVTAKAFTLLGDKRNIIHLEGKNLDPDENVRKFAKQCITMLRQGDIPGRKETPVQPPIQSPEIKYVSGSASPTIRDSGLYESKQPVKPEIKAPELKPDLVAQDKTPDIPPELTRPENVYDGTIVDGITPKSHISQLSHKVDLSNIQLDGPLLNTPVDSIPARQSDDVIKEEMNIYNTQMKDISADIKNKLESAKEELKIISSAKQQTEDAVDTDYIIESKYYDVEYDEEIDDSLVHKSLVEEEPDLEEEIQEELPQEHSIIQDEEELEDQNDVIESKYYDIDDDEEDDLDDLIDDEKLEESSGDIFESKYYDLVEEEDFEDDLVEEVESVQEIEEQFVPVEPVVEEVESVQEVEEEPAPVEPVIEEVEQPAPVESVVEEVESIQEVEEQPAPVESVVEEVEPIQEVVEQPFPVEVVVEEVESIQEVEEQPATVEPVVEEVEPVQEVEEQPALVEPVNEVLPLKPVEPVVKRIEKPIEEETKEDKYKDLILHDDSTEPYEEPVVEESLSEEVKEVYENYDLIAEDESEEAPEEEVLPQFKSVEKVSQVDLDDAYHSAKESGEEKVKIQAFGMVPQIEPEEESEPVNELLEKEQELVASDKEKEFIDKLLSKNLKDRKIAVKELATAKTKEALEALAHAATTDISWVRKEAIKSMVDIPHEEKITYLITFLSDSKWYIREEATKALGQIGSNRAIDPILNLLDDENKWVQETALRALAAIDMEETLPHIELQLNSSNVNVKSAAKHLLHNYKKSS